MEVEARRFGRLPQLQLAIPDGGGSPQVTLSSRSLMLVQVPVGHTPISKDTYGSSAWRRGQAGASQHESRWQRGYRDTAST